MLVSRRNAISMTTAGLIHVTANPTALIADDQRINDERNSDQQNGDLLIRQAEDRGHTDLGWLQSYHSFSFGRYRDEKHMGFRSLRVINDDRIAPGRGFPTHPHRNMEIISYVLDGSLQHKDSTGKGAVITPDDVQMMSAGRGITHSEYNPSRDLRNHFLQVWIEPALRGARPRYSDSKVTRDQKRAQWRQIAGPEDSKAAVKIRQDASIFATQLQRSESVNFTIERNRHAWLQVARGTLVVNGTRLRSGDAVATSRPTNLHITAADPTDALLFELG
ncbi:MAG: pirin family protein [Planctomycetota bacterium]